MSAAIDKFDDDHGQTRQAQAMVYGKGVRDLTHMQRIQAWGFAALVLGWVVGLSLVLGKDLNWDFLNYHYYGPYLMLEGRLQKDYFAGSLQSYLNPLAHVPQYLMIKAGWNGVLISSLLAAFHALNLWFIWRIAKAVLPQEESKRNMLPLLAVVLALLAPLFITTAGSSFADPTTSVPVLAATWLFIRMGAEPGHRPWAVVLAGLLLGLASGLKLTNAVLALGVIIPVSAWWFLNRAPRSALSFVLLIASCALGVVLMHGYWSWQLWQTFGNPLFPLFNSIFQAPDFPGATYRDTRFLGSGWQGLLVLPFQMMLPTTWLYAENAPVDMRFAFLVVVLVAGGFVLALAHFKVPGVSPRQAPSALVLLTAIFIASYIAWGMSSRIGRYALPVWLLLGPMIVAWAHLLLRRRHLVGVAVAVVSAAQVYALVQAGNPRWSPTEWDEKWLDVQVPTELQQRPLTVATLTSLSYSAIVPFLNPDSRAVNLVGQHIQPAGERMKPRLRELLATPAQDIRIVFNDRRPKRVYVGRLATETREDVDAILSMYGLILAPADCELIAITARHKTTNSPEEIAKLEAQGVERIGQDRLHVCRVSKLDPADHAKVLAARDQVAQAFNAIEHACGGRLNPHDTELLRGRLGWMRSYFNSLHSLMTNGEQVLVRPFRSMVDVDLGLLEQWMGPNSTSCPHIPAAINLPV